MTIRVNLRELINFYDSDAAMAKHANAIKIVAGEELNLAVLTHYFTSRGATANLLDAKCNTGPLKGSRLDAWLRVATDTVTFYQVEVKAWSFHGYGGGPALSIEHEPADGKRVRQEWWRRYWSASTSQFKQPALNKVLKRMKPPQGADVVEPLACLWAPLHPNGDAAPLFNVPLSGTGAFSRVWIFSVSTFLRECLRKSPHMELPLPQTKARLQHLTRLFGTEPAP